MSEAGIDGLGRLAGEEVGGFSVDGADDCGVLGGEAEQRWKRAR